MYHKDRSLWQGYLRIFGDTQHVEPPSDQEVLNQQNTSPEKSLDEILRSYAESHAGPALED